MIWQQKSSTPPCSYRSGYPTIVSRQVKQVFRSAGRAKAFTLVEVLVVVVIILAMAALVVPAFNGIKGGNDATKVAYELAGALEEARAYAMANSTYVYVGVQEVDSSVSESASPQTSSTASVGGRLAIAAIASRDGSRGYDMNSALSNPAWSAASYNKGKNFVALGKLRRFDNVHLATSIPIPGNSTASMYRPTVQPTYILGNNASSSVTPFAWPLGSDLDAAKCQYYFQKVIQFDPQGIARIQYSTNQDNVVAFMEAGLQPTQGNRVPAAPTDNLGRQAAIQLDAMNGSTRTYRP